MGFQKGDLLRAIKSFEGGPSSLKRGNYYVVRSLDASGDPILSHDPEDDRNGWAPHLLELVSRPVDGWYPWEGGENPVAQRQSGELWVRFRNGDLYQSQTSDGDGFQWGHRSTQGDIVAFRFADEPKAEVTEKEAAGINRTKVRRGDTITVRGVVRSVVGAGDDFRLDDVCEVIGHEPAIRVDDRVSSGFTDGVVLTLDGDEAGVRWDTGLREFVALSTLTRI